MQFDYTTLEEKFKKLPENVQYALTSPKISQDIQTISQKNGLMLDQMEILFDITTYVMLGLIPSNKFTTTLAKELNVSEKQAGLITSQISSEVFADIRESMREYEEKSRETYITSLGNTQMNAGTYPQSFQSINKTPIAQKPVEPEPVSPHADLEKAGGFTIEAIENPLPNIEQPKPKTVELPKIQENLPAKQPTEAKLEPTNNFNIHDYYNFRNVSKEETFVSEQNTNENKNEGGEEIIEDIKKEEGENVTIPTDNQEVVETTESEEKEEVPSRIIFQDQTDTDIKPDTSKPEAEVTTNETESVVTDPSVNEAEKEVEPKPLADYLTSEINNKSTVPDNLPTEEVSTPDESVKEDIKPPVTIETTESVEQVVQPIPNTPKPNTETKPRAFDPYREIPE